MRRYRRSSSLSQSLMGLIMLLGLGAYFGLFSLEGWQVQVFPSVITILVGGAILLVLGVILMWLIRTGWKHLQYQTAISKKLEEVDRMTGREFEFYIAYLLKAIGYEKINITGKQGDFGVDIIFEYQGESYAAQLKRHKHALGVSALYQVAGGQRYYGADHGAVITNAQLGSAAWAFANKTGIFVVDRKKLAEWIEYVQQKRPQPSSTFANPQS